ncbi:hypothetical protein BJ508DRAFT_219011, partial [Ascobolus immersus RN42]
MPESWYSQDDDTVRVVGPSYTSNWWKEEQSRLDAKYRDDPGHFLIVIIAASDATQLINLIGDQELNPVNFTLGNFDPDIRSCPTRAAWRSIGILPQNLKYSDLFVRPIRKLYQDGIKVVCPDGRVRFGHPILSGWIADYMETLKIFGNAMNSCPVCQIP